MLHETACPDGACHVHADRNRCDREPRSKPDPRHRRVVSSDASGAVAKAQRLLRRWEPFPALISPLDHAVITEP